MDDELAELLDIGLALQIAREREAVVLGLEQEEQLAHLTGSTATDPTASASAAKKALSSALRITIRLGFHSHPGSTPEKER